MLYSITKSTIKIGLFLLLASCSQKQQPYTYKKYWHCGSERPYINRGIKYFPQIHYRYSAIGLASWYGTDFHNKPTATGRIFNKNGRTAAHKTLPLPCVVLVENLENGKKMKVLVNDRGPFNNPKKRLIDVSEKIAIKLGFHKKGIAKVRITCLPSESRAVAKSYKRKPY